MTDAIRAFDLATDVGDGDQAEAASVSETAGGL